MKSFIRDITLFASRLTDQKVRMALIIFTLVMFILGAGAPDDAGGIFH
jgi:hypothetical protein